LSWSHFREFFPLKTRESKLFYAQKIYNENWGIRDLRKQIADKILNVQQLQIYKFQ